MRLTIAPTITEAPGDMCNLRDEDGTLVLAMVDRANAEHIMRAVNAYPVLIQALEFLVKNGDAATSDYAASVLERIK